MKFESTYLRIAGFGKLSLGNCVAALLPGDFYLEPA
jgi:hypothetical protein